MFFGVRGIGDNHSIAVNSRLKLLARSDFSAASTNLRICSTKSKPNAIPSTIELEKEGRT